MQIKFVDPGVRGRCSIGSKNPYGSYNYVGFVEKEREWKTILLVLGGGFIVVAYPRGENLPGVLLRKGAACESKSAGGGS